MQTRTLLLALTSALSLSACALSSSHHDTAPHWSYEGKEGPAHWGELSKKYVDCQHGRNQSPVDFSAAEQTSGGKLNHQYAPTPYTVVNNGHTIQAAPAQGGQTLQLGNRAFALKQFHFHTPSEHSFRGELFPMEVHFVHQDADDNLAVLGVVFQEGAENPALTPLLAQPLKSGQTAQLASALDIRQMLPADTRHFRLSGSLTTPPCSEGVNWVVFKTPVTASKAQIAAMRAMIGQNNNRPVQPLNARVIIEEAR